MGCGLPANAAKPVHRQRIIRAADSNDETTNSVHGVACMIGKKRLHANPNIIDTQALQLRRGLAQEEAPVNWDPVDQTVLANEQVLPDGTAERSGPRSRRACSPAKLRTMHSVLDDLINWKVGSM